MQIFSPAAARSNLGQRRSTGSAEFGFDRSPLSSRAALSAMLRAAACSSATSKASAHHGLQDLEGGDVRPKDRLTAHAPSLAQSHPLPINLTMPSLINLTIPAAPFGKASPVRAEVDDRRTLGPGRWETPTQLHELHPSSMDFYGCSWNGIVSSTPGAGSSFSSSTSSMLDPGRKPPLKVGSSSGKKSGLISMCGGSDCALGDDQLGTGAGP